MQQSRRKEKRFSEEANLATGGVQQGAHPAIIDLHYRNSVILQKFTLQNLSIPSHLTTHLHAFANSSTSSKPQQYIPAQEVIFIPEAWLKYTVVTGSKDFFELHPSRTN